MRLAAKISMVTSGLIVLLIVASGFLLFRLEATAKSYDRILQQQTSQEIAARQLQYAFEKQVGAWSQVLIQGANGGDTTASVAEFRADAADVTELVSGLQKAATDPIAASLIKRLVIQHFVLDQRYGVALEALHAHGDVAEADAFVRGLNNGASQLIDAVAARLRTTGAQQYAAQRESVQKEAKVVVGGGLAILAALIAAMIIVIRRITGPVREMTSSANDVAARRLPELIAEIRNQDADMAPPSLPPFEVRSRDEMRDLGRAFTSMQNSALALAVEQHRNEQAAANMLVNLGRRNQNLLTRTLGYITDLEREEKDTPTLDKLFRLDHLATRIRRNAESMLVLAGAESTRASSRPVPVINLVRAALSEIEDYTRVDVSELDPASIQGGAAADVSHLLAELVENATHFSQKETRVTVTGRAAPEGYALSISDSGVGMSEEQLAAANRLLSGVSDQRPDAKFLGHYVVSQLARRRGIRVSLTSIPAGGITALVEIDSSTLASVPPSSPVPETAEASVPETVEAPAAAGTTAAAPRQEPSVPAQQASSLVDERPAASPSAWGQAEHEGASAILPVASAGLPPAPRQPAESPAAPAAGWSAPAAPRRVPGAQLPDTDLEQYAETSIPRDAGAVRSQLGALQAGVDAARSTAQSSSPDETPPAPEWSGTAAPQAPRRVRGAQLPDTGPEQYAQTPIPRDAGAVRSQLGALQAGVDAARSTAQSSSPDETPPAPESSATPTLPALLRRVRGAQLPDTGPEQDDVEDAWTRSPVEVQSQLSNLQSRVSAARHLVSGDTDPQGGLGGNEPEGTTRPWDQQVPPRPRSEQ